MSGFENKILLCLLLSDNLILKIIFLTLRLLTTDTGYWEKQSQNPLRKLKTFEISLIIYQFNGDWNFLIGNNY